MEEQFVDDAQELNYQQENQLADIALEEVVEDRQDEEKIVVMNVAIEAILHAIVDVAVEVEDAVAGKDIDFFYFFQEPQPFISCVYKYTE